MDQRNKSRTLKSKKKKKKKKRTSEFTQTAQGVSVTSKRLYTCLSLGSPRESLPKASSEAS